MYMLKLFILVAQIKLHYKTKGHTYSAYSLNNMFAVISSFLSQAK